MRRRFNIRWLLAGLCLLPLPFACIHAANDSSTGSGQRVTSEVTSVAFSPDNRTLAIGYKNLTLNIIELKTGRMLREFKGEYPAEANNLNQAVFSPDGKTLVCGFSGTFGDLFDIWDIATGKVKRSVPKAAQSLAFSPDGKTLAGGGAEWRREKWTVATFCWDTQTGKLRQTLRRPIGGTVRSIVFSPDGKTLLTVNDTEDAKAQMITLDTLVSLWNVESGKLRWSMKEKTAMPLKVAFSPTGKVIANIGPDRVHLRDARTGKLLRLFKAPDKMSYPEAPAWPTALSFSPNGAVLVIGTTLGSVTLWNVKTGHLLKTFNNHIGPITTLAYSSDSKLIASGSADYTVNIWDAKTGKVIRTIGKQDANRPSSLS